MKSISEVKSSFSFKSSAFFACSSFFWMVNFIIFIADTPINAINITIITLATNLFVFTILIFFFLFSALWTSNSSCSETVLFLFAEIDEYFCSLRSLLSEKLYINIPSATLDGKSTRKSSFITLLEQIANFKIKGEVTKTEEVDNIYDIYSKDELFMWLIRNIRIFDNLDDAKKEEVISVYEYFKKDNNYSKILEFKKDDSKLSNEVIDIVYSNEFKTSVSKLELYKKCPFSYFMQYILKVKQ